MAAAARAVTALPSQSNWLSEWVTRTPVVTRYAVYTVLPISIAGFWPEVSSALILTPQAVFGGQVWRLLTMLPVQLVSGLSFHIHWFQCDSKTSSPALKLL